MLVDLIKKSQYNLRTLLAGLRAGFLPAAAARPALVPPAGPAAVPFAALRCLGLFAPLAARNSLSLRAL